MSKTNSSVNLNKHFKDFAHLENIYSSFEKKLNNFKKKKFLVAVSGGPDSLALAAFSQFYSSKIGAKFLYAHVNHNLRKNSYKESLLVKKILERKKIKLKILTNNKKITKNVQSQARLLRYELLARYSKSKNLNTILTAHNLEDQVETFFIRLSRGSGLTGLSSMEELTKLGKNLSLFRPFLDVKKKDLIKISKLTYGEFIIDPSNKNTKYLRTKIRSLKIPLLRSGICYDQIIKSIKNLSSSKKTLEDYLKKVFGETIIRSGNKIEINLKNFNKYNTEIKMRILNESFKKISLNYYYPRSAKVLNLIKKLNYRSFKKSTLGGSLIIKKKDILVLKKEKNPLI